MRKQIGFALVAYCVLVVAGTATLTYWDRLGTPQTAVRPEGYSLPEAEAPVVRESTGPVRVMHLDVADGVYRHLDRSLEMVAMTPGSGWMRLKTEDGISPLISFDRVETRDIRQFNRFAESIRQPVRVRLEGDRLEVFTVGTESERDRFAERSDAKPVRKIAFYRPQTEKTKLVMRRDANGRVYLVDANATPKKNAETLAAK